MSVADLPLDGRELAPGPSQLGQVLTPLERHLGREPLAERGERAGSKKSSRMARRARASTSCRLMLRRFVQVPRDRALKQVSRSCDERMKPPPQDPHCVSPEKRYFGRRARTIPALMVYRVEACRALAACQRSSSTIRSSGTSFVIHSDAGSSAPHVSRCRDFSRSAAGSRRTVRCTARYSGCRCHGLRVRESCWGSMPCPSVRGSLPHSASCRSPSGRRPRRKPGRSAARSPLPRDGSPARRVAGPPAHAPRGSRS